MNKRIYKKKIIVTGGAGFIGSHMVDLLMKKNYTVIVIDNLSNGRKLNIKNHLNKKNFFLKKLDICKIKKESEWLKNTDYIFHFAGIGDIVPSIQNPSKYNHVNVQGTVNMLEIARHNKIKKFIYAASSSCYGLVKGKVSEKVKIKAEHPYALSKYMGELSVMHWHKVYNLPVNSMRIFNAYGPRVRTTGAYGAVIGVFFKQRIEKKPLTIVGDGKQTRDFIHVSDVVRAFYLAAKKNISGQIFNLGTGHPYSINYLANIVGGKKIRLPDRPGEPKNFCANNTKLKKTLKWQPKIKFYNGINEMLKNLNDWSKAPLWTKNKIKKATKEWFKYLSKKK